MNEKEQKIHSLALKQFDNIQSLMSEERLQCLEDRRFYTISGAQWEGDLGDQFANKPKMEVNKIMLSIIKIFNEYRNNRVTVDFVSKDGKERDDLASVCDGLYRASEQDSCAEEAYDNAFEEGVGGGFGAWRLCNEYEDNEDEEDDTQKISILPIFDADSSVYFDPNAKRQDKADAKYCFVITSKAKDDYEEEYGSFSSVDVSNKRSEFDWNTPDVAYIAEYYVVEEVKDVVKTYQTLGGELEKYYKEDFEENENLEEELSAIGTKLVKIKRIEKKKVRKYILSGDRILEDCGYIAGSCIPIVPFYGKRWFIDNIERCMGHVRLVKDAQRLKNMQISKLAEISAASSVEKPILTPEQVAGHQQMWSDDNVKDYPYLLINPIMDASGNMAVSAPVAYTKAPNIPPAMAALLSITENDIKEMLGNQQGGEQIVSNISGKAVELIQQRLDMQTFIYMSNFAKAMKRSGEIWLSMAKDIYVEKGRKLKTINQQGEAGVVELIQPYDKNGVITYKNDLSDAKFDIVVDVGPSSATKKQATVRALTGMMQVVTDPNDMNVLSSLAIMNMEGEGLKHAQKYARRKLIKMGVVEPDEDEARELMAEAQNTPPTPQDEYFRKAAANEDAKAKQANANTIKILADAEQSQAKTIETYANLNTMEQQQALEAIKVLQGIVKNGIIVNQNPMNGE